MSQYSFGSGSLFGKSLVNTPATPVRFGGLQDISVDIGFTTKELYGSYQFPLAVGRGTGKISGKANFARFNAQLFNDLFFGGSTAPTANSVRTVLDEAQTVTANIVTATHNSTFTSDLGIVLASDGTLFTRVTNTPVGQQYSCNESTGVYTFNSSQANVAVQVNYTYTDASNGRQIAITNQLLGTSPQFSCVFTEQFTRGSSTKKMTLVLNACMSSKLTLATKLEDFTIPAFEFSAYADDANNIGTLSVEEL